MEFQDGGWRSSREKKKRAVPPPRAARRSSTHAAITQAATGLNTGRDAADAAAVRSSGQLSLRSAAVRVTCLACTKFVKMTPAEILKQFGW